MKQLSAVEVRVLGCLMEKRETTPDHYPLTLNALRNACNQKSSRHPVTAYDEGTVSHTVRQLIDEGLAREDWGARAAKYEHLAGAYYGIQSKGIAVLCTMMLRGPQTLGELRNHSHRMYDFDDLDDVQYVLQKLAEMDPPMVVDLPRQPGQKEGRYAHLLAGEVKVESVQSHQAAAPAPGRNAGLETRVSELENQVRELTIRLEALADIPAD